jgi:hypothetical protein
MTVAVLNPLGAGLAHYTDSLEHVLTAAGVATRRIDVTEPSSADYGKARWLASYFREVSRAVDMHQTRAVVATWPALGYLDLAILSGLARAASSYLVMHDPRPLVYARGYGSSARLLARRSRINCKLIVHSDAAAQAVREDAAIDRMVQVPHPMLAPAAASQTMSARKTIRVLGQFKADRDILGLRRLAVAAPSTWQLEIIGRGWPSIDGWQVTNAFVDEVAFGQLIDESDAVLVPYRRFFQSGVAVRALEAGVPVVGPHDSSLSELLGPECQWLVRDGDWFTAVMAAVDTERDHVFASAQIIYERVIAQWWQALTMEGLC